MKIKFSFHCYKCLNLTDKTKQGFEKLNDQSFEFEVNDENLYEGTCDKGHKMFFTLQEQKFQILFNFAAIALLDGYTKEAVSTLSSSYERFIEFYIRVICISKSIEEDAFLKMWNKMKNQSERQIGAFYALQLIDFGSTKYLLDENWAKFRNKVVHQGYIPKSDEAIKYGEYILSNINMILKYLNDSRAHSLRKAILNEVFQKHKQANSEQIITMSKPTIINLNTASLAKGISKSFRESLDSLKEIGWDKHIYLKKS